MPTDFSSTTTNLPALQNLIKRDPEGYQEEFLRRYRHFQSIVELHCQRPMSDSKDLVAHVGFVSAVSPCYPDATAGLPTQLGTLLEEHHAALDPALRAALLQALILLRNRAMMPPLQLLQLCFRLFRCHDKALRDKIFAYVVSDIKNVNLKHKDMQLNKVRAADALHPLRRRRRPCHIQRRRQRANRPRPLGAKRPCAVDAPRHVAPPCARLAVWRSPAPPNATRAQRTHSPRRFEERPGPTGRRLAHRRTDAAELCDRDDLRPVALGGQALAPRYDPAVQEKRLARREDGQRRRERVDVPAHEAARRRGAFSAGRARRGERGRLRRRGGGREGGHQGGQAAHQAEP
eukprot:5488654-Prymnesium_polylepis.2